MSRFQLDDAPQPALSLGARPLTVGVVGCGRIAERHVEAYRKFESVRVIVADQDQAATHRLADAQHVEWADSADELLRRADIDAVDVCVPTPAHAGIVLAALECGKHVFCEKPLCETQAQAEEIAAAQATSRRLVMVGYLYRFHPAFQFAKHVLDDQVIGKPYFGIFRLGGRGSHRAWKHTTDAGGGATLEMMVHNLDLIQWLLGPAADVAVLGRETFLPSRVIDGGAVQVDAEDYVLAELQMRGGARVLCESDLVTPSYMNYVEIQGENGTLFTSILNYLPTVVYCREPRGVFNLGNNVQQFQTVNLFERELGHFIQVLRSEVPPMNVVEESIDVMAIVDRIREGKSIDGR